MSNFKTENITREELNKLTKFKDSIRKKILVTSFGSGILFVILFLIPKKYLPLRLVSELDKSFFQSYYNTSIAIIILILVFTLITSYFYYKYPKISKDVKERKKVIMKVVITKIEKPAPLAELYDIYFTPSYKTINKIQIFNKEQLSNLRVNKSVEIIASKNALYPFSLEHITNKRQK